MKVEPLPTEPKVKPEPPVAEISLRDWLAGMAMQGLVSSNVPIRGTTATNDDFIRAQEAYRIADAMLQERERTMPKEK